MHALPPALPDRLIDYAPGRIHEVSADAWPLVAIIDRVGVSSEIPRYALEVLTARVDIDPERVRWLAEESSVRLLHSRHVHLATHQGRLHVVDGHHALAAHLATGADRIPVRLVTAA